MEVSVSDDEDDQLILLVCTNPTPTPDPYHNHPIEEFLTDIILSDLSTFLNFHTIKLHAHRNRLIHHSLYFRGLLSGSFRLNKILIFLFFYFIAIQNAYQYFCAVNHAWALSLSTGICLCLCKFLSIYMAVLWILPLKMSSLFTR